MASVGSKSPTSLYTWTAALEVYSPSPPTRSAITAKASGTLGSGTWAHPVGIGSTMLSALKSAAFCGSIATFFSLKKSVRVPDEAGTMAGDGCGGKRADGDGRDGQLVGADGGRSGRLRLDGDGLRHGGGRGYCGLGERGLGGRGGACEADDARRSGGEPSCQKSPTTGILEHLTSVLPGHAVWQRTGARGQAPTVSTRRRMVTRAGIDLQPCPDHSATEPIPSRCPRPAPRPAMRAPSRALTTLFT